VDLKSLQVLINEGQVLYSPAQQSVIGIKGRDARDFLQRMSTNDMNMLGSEKPLITCFLNNKGRLIDVVIVFQKNHDDFLLISSFEEPNKLISWLESFHFVEEFSLEQQKGLFSTYALSLNQLKSPYAITLASLPQSLSLKGQLSFLLSQKPLEESFCRSDFRMLAVCSLLPGVSEINESFMPQNVGLSHTISETKGCYIGQEVIAKALTYQKNTKSLKAFTLSKEDYDRASVGMKVEDLSKRVGIITSLAPYFLCSWPQGLAVMEDKSSLESPKEYIKVQLMV